MTASRTFLVPTAEAMRSLGEQIGGVCRGGDVVILSGDLGAGKTTIAQGIGRGVGIDEPVTSPTFVIARVHKNPGGGPDLVHVDAYRLGSISEVEDLDLESDLDASVLVVEWGDGLLDALTDSRVVVRIERSEIDGDDRRTVELVSVGARWQSIVHDLTGIAP